MADVLARSREWEPVPEELKELRSLIVAGEMYEALKQWEAMAAVADGIVEEWLTDAKIAAKVCPKCGLPWPCPIIHHD
jgi:hypothetical protein